MKLIVLTTHMNVSSPAFQGRSAVSISSFANGACGEHRRHDSEGIRLESADRRVGPQGSPATLTRIPDLHDLLSVVLARVCVIGAQ
jgi:hypothetical protein